MSIARIKIVLRKDKISSKGIGPLYIRFIKDRKPQYITTGINIESKFWDFEKSLIKNTHPNSARMNNILKKLEIEYYKKTLKAQSENLKIDTRKLKQEVVGYNTTSFYAIAEKLIYKYKVEGKIGTMDKAKSIINKIKQFCKKEDLSFEEITVSFITDYELFLTEKFQNKRNTINKDLKFIKRVFNYAIQQDFIKDSSNPFKKIILHTETTTRDFLSPDEIKLLEDFTGSDLEMKCIATCLFQYYSGGLRISDVLLLRTKDVENGRIKLNIRKTGKQLNHILTDQAQTILKELITNKQDKDLIFNFMKNDKKLKDTAEAIDSYISSTTALINKYLKIVCDKVGIKKHISTHNFRHSFAVNALEKGLRMEHLQMILKHSNIRETQIYGRIQSKDVDDALKHFSTN